MLVIVGLLQIYKYKCNINDKNYQCRNTQNGLDVVWRQCDYYIDDPTDRFKFLLAVGCFFGVCMPWLQLFGEYI